MSIQSTTPQRFNWMTLLPVVIFGAFAIVAFIGLGNDDPSRIPSALIDKPAPVSAMPALKGVKRGGQSVPGIDEAAFHQGKISLVNIWGSWCVPCRQEHPMLMQLAARGDIQLVGINYKDEPQNARRFLGSFGNPYNLIGVDQNGRNAVEWGVYGVPETFLVDGKGQIRHKWIGPLNPTILAQDLMPKIEELKAGQTATPRP